MKEVVFFLNFLKKKYDPEFILIDNGEQFCFTFISVLWNTQFADYMFVPGDVLITSTDGSPCNLCLYEHPVFTIEGQQGI